MAEEQLAGQLLAGAGEQAGVEQLHRLQPLGEHAEVVFTDAADEVDEIGVPIRDASGKMIAGLSVAAILMLLRFNRTSRRYIGEMAA